MRLVIIHFNDLNGYPPAVNLIEYISNTHPEDWKLTVLTTRSSRIPIILADRPIPLINVAKFSSREGKIRRAIKYFWFNLFSLITLIRVRPKVVFYFETISSFAPCVYKKYFSKRARVFAHYHEYVSPQEYENGMTLVSKLHGMEMPLYSSFDWISHTNQARMDLFLNDIGMTESKNSHLLPNYPPQKWYEEAMKIKRIDDERVAMVYVGALSFESMYVKEIFDFISTRENEYLLDIFSITYDADVIAYLNKLNAKNIRFLGPLKYSDIPQTVPAYDVGLILYKGTTANFSLNAPNKFFEYLVCGVNVIYPVQMEGMKEYQQPDGCPKVVGIDFGHLESITGTHWRKCDQPFSTEYSAESIYSKVVAHLAAVQ